MKNVLVYVNPNQRFDEETEILVKIQIDNSLDLGWDRNDIIILANFDYEYNGVKTKTADSVNYCYFRPLSTKTVTVANFLNQGMFQKDELYWVHDFDAYQLIPIQEKDLKLNGHDLGLTTYGWSRKWCLGSYFFRESAKDIFGLLKEIIYKYKIEDERAMVALSISTNNIDNRIRERIKELDISYQIGQRHLDSNYKIAKKPLKIVHFHPNRRSVLNSFMYGANPMKIPLMPERLTKIFNFHGIQ